MEGVTVSQTDLAKIVASYSEVTERLKQSHELLGREVCRLREQLKEKNKELERRERLAALGEMAAGVAHEIRNPLGAIGLYASLLERDLKDRPEPLDIARRMSVGVRNLESIIGDILSFAGGVEPNRRTVRLGDVLDSALSQAAPQARVLEVTIEANPDLGEVELFCDPGQLERALLNLIFNALDAVGRGGRVWIRSGEGRAGTGLFPIAVEDNGPGIDPDLMQRVFNPFFTTKDNGTGLGLAIVHRIAESNGGCVSAGNREGGGAALSLSLPRAGSSNQTEKAGGGI